MEPGWLSSFSLSTMFCCSIVRPVAELTCTLVLVVVTPEFAREAESSPQLASMMMLAASTITATKRIMNPIEMFLMEKLPFS
jgi:hypothetical protein